MGISERELSERWMGEYHGRVLIEKFPFIDNVGKRGICEWISWMSRSGQDQDDIDFLRSIIDED